jgi:hypothetical protein
MNNNGFIAHTEITNPKDLFGRTELLRQLQILANNRNTVSIIGLRRFGKTSVLRCLEFLLRNDDSSNVYPLYFDFKEVGSIVIGTENVYRYMVARLVERLFLDKHFTSPTVFKKKKIIPSDDWIEIFEDLMDVNPVRIQSLFEEIVSFFAEYIDKTILFIFDEYEHLFRFSFTQPEGFMKLRNFSSKIVDGKVIPFSFFVCGAISWEYLCTLTGSGELNCIDHTAYIPPIGNLEFTDMWNSETKKVDNCDDKIINGAEITFNSSGGVPFYGKIIGSNWVLKNQLPTHFILQSYFQEILNSLTIEQKSILNELAKGPKSFKNSKHILELIENGLIKKDGTNLSIKIGFLRDHILSIQNDENSINKVNSQIEGLAENVAKLIMTINNTYKSKRGSYIFEPVNDEAALLKDMRTPCISLSLFSDFANSLYKTVFERTKKKVNGTDIALKRLPNPYKRGHKFIDVVDIMRHSLGGGHLMDTFTHRKGQMKKEEMLKILTDSKNDPNSEQEFLNLQLASLNMFVKELNNLNTIVRNLT